MPVANKSLIRSTALAVIRNGTSFYEWLREKRKSDDAYSFLFGGDGADYYKWCLMNGEAAFKDITSADATPADASHNSHGDKKAIGAPSESPRIRRESSAHPDANRPRSPWRGNERDMRSRSRERKPHPLYRKRTRTGPPSNVDRAWGRLRHRSQEYEEIRHGRMYAWSDDDSKDGK